MQKKEEKIIGAFVKAYVPYECRVGGALFTFWGSFGEHGFSD